MTKTKIEINSEQANILEEILNLFRNIIQLEVGEEMTFKFKDIEIGLKKKSHKKIEVASANKNKIL